ECATHITVIVFQPPVAECTGITELTPPPITLLVVICFPKVDGLQQVLGLQGCQQLRAPPAKQFLSVRLDLLIGERAGNLTHSEEEPDFFSSKCVRSFIYEILHESSELWILLVLIVSCPETQNEAAKGSMS